VGNKFYLGRKDVNALAADRISTSRALEVNKKNKQD